MKVILGAGLSGLSASHHLGHENCLLLERSPHPYGHIHSEFLNGFTWDEGPHVSFTKNDYVKELFFQSVDWEFEEYPIRTTNYYHSHWIDHPAQSNLYQVPEPLRSACIASFLEAGKTQHTTDPANYQEWLNRSLGKVFAETFSAAYTRKYWTVDPVDLTWKWVGPRVFRPRTEDILQGSRGPLPAQTHYISQVRYPKNGGYQSFAKKLKDGAEIHLDSEVAQIDLREKTVYLASGKTIPFETLISTIPLPVFISSCVDVPKEIKEAADALACSSALLINVEVAHTTSRPENWIYVYDEEKWSTRINCTELLSPNNAPSGCSGIQVEVYFSKFRPQLLSDAEIAEQVVEELIEMGLIRSRDLKGGGLQPEEVTPKDHPLGLPPGSIRWHTKKIPWANVIFDHPREPALDRIFGWLEPFGLHREPDDLEPFTNWEDAGNKPIQGSLVMAGRFAQWKYFWTDDCVLRGRQLATEI